MTELQHSLVLVKPDGVARGLIGEVIRRIEAKGYALTALEMRTATPELLAQHYAEHVGKPFYPALVAYMSQGPLVAMRVTGYRVIEGVRALLGATDPTTALPGSVRGDLACATGGDAEENVMHASDSPEAAERELALWFA